MKKSWKEAAGSMVISNLIYLAGEDGYAKEHQRYFRQAARFAKKKMENTRTERPHIIFDLDGTLIDTEKAVLETWRYTLKDYSYEFTRKELQAVLGIVPGQALKQLKVSVDPQFWDLWQENYLLFAEGAAFFDGVEKMLQTLKQKGYALGIVTSRTREEYETYFSDFHLERYFDVVILADDTERHKPDPEPLIQYAKEVQIPLESCIYIGDMPTDIECANRAGIRSGLVQWNHSGVICPAAGRIFSSPDKLAEAFPPVK